MAVSLATNKIKAIATPSLSFNSGHQKNGTLDPVQASLYLKNLALGHECILHHWQLCEHC